MDTKTAVNENLLNKLLALESWFDEQDAELRSSQAAEDRLADEVGRLTVKLDKSVARLDRAKAAQAAEKMAAETAQRAAEEAEAAAAEAARKAIEEHYRGAHPGASKFMRVERDLAAAAEEEGNEDWLAAREGEVVYVNYGAVAAAQANPTEREAMVMAASYDGEQSGYVPLFALGPVHNLEQLAQNSVFMASSPSEGGPGPLPAAPAAPRMPPRDEFVAQPQASARTNTSLSTINSRFGSPAPVDRSAASATSSSRSPPGRYNPPITTLGQTRPKVAAAAGTAREPPEYAQKHQYIPQLTRADLNRKIDYHN